MALPLGYEEKDGIFFGFPSLGDHGLNLMLWFRNEDQSDPYVVAWLFCEGRGIRMSTRTARTTQQLRVSLFDLLRHMAPGIETTMVGRMAYLGLPHGFVEKTIAHLKVC